MIHSSSVQNAVLKGEVQQLREALVSERSRRKRGKPLPLQEAEEYHGGAQFFGPGEVQTARDRRAL